jgi:hypothetical protein
LPFAGGMCIKVEFFFYRIVNSIKTFSCPAVKENFFEKLFCKAGLQELQKPLNI